MAVVCARTAEEHRMRSGIRSSSCNKAPITGAEWLPRLLSGRSWSDSAGWFQLDLAWRRRSNVFKVFFLSSRPWRDPLQDRLETFLRQGVPAFIAQVVEAAGG